MKYKFNTEEETASFAKTLANKIKALGLWDIKIYLTGDLGAGKTTFSRYFLNALGVLGDVKSPTYAIVETYAVDNHDIFHIDLYRISEEEIFDLGFLEEDRALWLIEWPEKGGRTLPVADIILSFRRSESSLEVKVVSNDDIRHQLFSD